MRAHARAAATRRKPLGMGLLLAVLVAALLLPAGASPALAQNAAAQADAVPARSGEAGEGAGASQADERLASTFVGSNDDLTDSQRAALGGGMGFLPSEVRSSDVTSVSIARLERADTDLDGRLVSFIGEVVGEPVSILGGGVWVLMMSSDSSSIMVAMTEDQAALIENYGQYETRGTTLRVTGIYRLADPDNMGDLDVVAYGVRMVDAGGYRGETVNYPLMWVAVGSVAVALVLVGVNVMMRMRKR